MHICIINKKRHHEDCWVCTEASRLLSVCAHMFFEQHNGRMCACDGLSLPWGRLLPQCSPSVRPSVRGSLSFCQPSHMPARTPPPPRPLTCIPGRPWECVSPWEHVYHRLLMAVGSFPDATPGNLTQLCF